MVMKFKGFVIVYKINDFICYLVIYLGGKSWDLLFVYVLKDILII